MQRRRGDQRSGIAQGDRVAQAGEAQQAANQQHCRQQDQRDLASGRHRTSVEKLRRQEAARRTIQDPGWICYDPGVGGRPSASIVRNAMQATLVQNVIPLFGYCVRGCGQPAVRRQLLPNGDQLCLCADEPRCAPADQPRPMPAYCDPANEVRGKLYDRNLDVKEIAKRMRQAIKAELPGVKCSVKISRYSGGQAIDISLREASFNTKPIIPMQQWYEERDRAGIMRSWKENFERAMVQAMARLKQIHGRWNRDNSDNMSDYFNINYYGSVTDPNGSSW